MVERYVAVASLEEGGVITLPAELLRRLRLDEEGVRLEMVERDDGVVELRPSIVIPADQKWFWTEQWQAMEREADSDIKSGRVQRAQTVGELFEILAVKD